MGFRFDNASGAIPVFILGLGASNGGRRGDLLLSGEPGRHRGVHRSSVAVSHPLHDYVLPGKVRAADVSPGAYIRSVGITKTVCILSSTVVYRLLPTGVPHIS